jgi:hypothetical protein
VSRDQELLGLYVGKGAVEDPFDRIPPPHVSRHPLGRVVHRVVGLGIGRREARWDRLCSLELKFEVVTVQLKSEFVGDGPYGTRSTLAVIVIIVILDLADAHTKNLHK